MGLDRGGLCCRHGPGTWKWLKLLDVMHLGPGPRKPRLGAVFGASREVPSSAVFLPQYFLFPLPPALRSEVLYSKD